MSIEVAKSRIQEQAKIFQLWCPWTITFSQARDLIAIAWGFTNWDEFISASINKGFEGDKRFEPLFLSSIGDEQKEVLVYSICDLSIVIEEHLLLARSIHRQGAEMLVDAFYGTKKPRPVLSKAGLNDWEMHEPAHWFAANGHLHKAYSTDDKNKISAACHKVINQFATHIEALGCLASCLLEEGDLQNAFQYSSKAYSVCQQAMGFDFDMMKSSVLWSNVQNRSFHKAILTHAEVLIEMQKGVEAKELLVGLLSMDPNDYLGVSQHELITADDLAIMHRRKNEIEDADLQALADMNAVSLDDMKEAIEKKMKSFEEECWQSMQ